MKMNTLLGAWLISLTSVLGQGTLTFDEPWIFSGAASTKSYEESGMLLRAVAPPPSSSYNSLVRVGSMGTTGAHNGTPHMRWHNDSGHQDYVILSRLNGSLFGLSVVDLGNFESSLQFSIAITFNGFKADGSMVSATFQTLTNNFSSFTRYQFSPAFASGLTRVEIPSKFWSMDNLVVVPEPRTYALLALGLLALAARRRNR